MVEGLESIPAQEFVLYNTLDCLEPYSAVHGWKQFQGCAYLCSVVTEAYHLLCALSMESGKFGGEVFGGAFDYTLLLPALDVGIHPKFFSDKARTEDGPFKFLRNSADAAASAEFRVSAGFISQRIH